MSYELGVIRKDRTSKKQGLRPIMGGPNWDEDKNAKRIN